MPNTWKFVDQPVASPTVLLDMNDGNTWKTLGGDSFKLPSPPLKRSIASNTMVDGGLLTASAYDLRTLTFTVDLKASTDTGRIAQLDALKAQLAKPSNLIMHQLQTASSPVFFRTLRSDDYVVDAEISANFWRISCNVLAEPFAIGTRRDLTTVTVTNDPAAGTNPARWDITGIAGDAPTPAFVRVQGLGAGGTAILAQRTANNPAALTVFAQAEAATLGTDTSTSAASNTSNGNGTFTSFATNSSLVTRLTVNVPTATSADALRGRYRVVVRAHSADTTSVFTIRYQQNAAGDSYVGPTLTWSSPNSSNWYLLDLGVIDVPAFQTPQAIGYSALTPALATPSLAIQAGRSSGSSNLDLDYVYLVPASERWCSVSQTGAVGYIVLDGPQDMTYGMAAGSSPFSATLASRTVDNAAGLVPRFGGLPQLVPGTTNRWYLLVDGAATVSSTKTVDVSYWPRWREVATS